MANSTEVAGFDKKWAAAGGLAVVLIAVLYFQFAGSTPSGPPQASAKRPALPNPPNGTASPSSSSDTSTAASPTRQVAPWPKLARETVQHYDPFAWPADPASDAGDSTGSGAANSAQPAKFTSSAGSENSESLEDQAADRESRRMEHRRQRRELLADLQRHGVAAILLRDDGNTALVGERRIRVGDVIDGFEVKQINRDGVVLVDQATDPTP